MRGFFVAALIAASPGCSVLPASAPTIGEIESAGQRAASDYVVLDVDESIVLALARVRPDGFSGRFSSRAPAADLRVAVGDTLQISIIEEGAGLFRGNAVSAAGETPTTGAAGTSLLPVTVARDGSVHVPFAGQISAAGRTLDSLRAEIERKLAEKAINPQVQISLGAGTGSSANSATVGGEVNRSGIIPLQPSGSRLLDVVAEAGGPHFPAYETTVHLTRQGRQATASLEEVVDHAGENIFIYPHDNIYLSHDPQTFSVLGASAKVGLYPFGSKRLDLAEAVAEAGGFVDAVSDPAGVFLFRFEPAAFVRSLKETRDLQFGAEVPVIYRLSLREGNGYFLARQFDVRDKDIILLANADGTQLLKFITLLQGATATVANLRTVTLSSGGGVTTTTTVTGH